MTILGLLLLYIDIYISRIDVLPDLLGYIFLFIVIFRGWFYQKRYSSGLLVYAIIAAAIFMLAEAERVSAVITMGFMMLSAVWQWLLVRRLYRENEGDTPLPQRPVIQTALLGILLCQMSAPVLGLAFPMALYILGTLQGILGLLVAFWMRRTMKNSSEVNKQDE